MKKETPPIPPWSTLAGGFLYKILDVKLLRIRFCYHTLLKEKKTNSLAETWPASFNHFSLDTWERNQEKELRPSPLWCQISSLQAWHQKLGSKHQFRMQQLVRQVLPVCAIILLGTFLLLQFLVRTKETSRWKWGVQPHKMGHCDALQSRQDYRFQSCWQCHLNSGEYSRWAKTTVGLVLTFEKHVNRQM